MYHMFPEKSSGKTFFPEKKIVVFFFLRKAGQLLFSFRNKAKRFESSSETWYIKGDCSKKLPHFI